MSLALGCGVQLGRRQKLKRRFGSPQSCTICCPCQHATSGVLAPQSFAVFTLLSCRQIVPASTCSALLSRIASTYAASFHCVLLFVRFWYFVRALLAASTCERRFLSFGSARLSKVSLVRVLAACNNSTASFRVLQVLVARYSSQQRVGARQQPQPNKALHPTAYSSVRSSLRFRRRVSLSFARLHHTGLRVEMFLWQKFM